MKKDMTPQQEASRRALDLKNSSAPERPYLDLHESAPGEGRVQAPREPQPVSGAFGAEGNEPVLRRSRHVR